MNNESVAVRDMSCFCSSCLSGDTLNACLSTNIKGFEIKEWINPKRKGGPKKVENEVDDIVMAENESVINVLDQIRVEHCVEHLPTSTGRTDLPQF